jgi:hypothetical protein
VCVFGAGAGRLGSQTQLDRNVHTHSGWLVLSRRSSRERRSQGPLTQVVVAWGAPHWRSSTRSQISADGLDWANKVGGAALFAHGHHSRARTGLLARVLFVRRSRRGSGAQVTARTLRAAPRFSDGKRVPGPSSCAQHCGGGGGADSGEESKYCLISGARPPRRAANEGARDCVRGGVPPPVGGCPKTAGGNGGATTTNNDNNSGVGGTTTTTITRNRRRPRRRRRRPPPPRLDGRAALASALPTL